MLQSFRTHTGKIVTGERLVAALNEVADEKIELSKAIRLEDAYADHVSEQVKDQIMIDGFAYAESIRKGEINDLTAWQNLNYALTGECVALLP
jgi:hypothetical protein